MKTQTLQEKVKELNAITSSPEKELAARDAQIGNLLKRVSELEEKFERLTAEIKNRAFKL